MLGERLKQLRKSKKLTQIDFAKLFNVANGTVGNWESNARHPDYDTILRMSEFFGVSVDYLFGREEKNPTTNSDSEISKTKTDIIEKIMQMSDEELQKLDLLLQVVESK